MAFLNACTPAPAMLAAVSRRYNLPIPDAFHAWLQWDAVSRELAAAIAASAAAAAAATGDEAPASGGGHVRPPLACLQRYQQLLAGAGKEPPKFESTNEGIARLAPLVAKHGSTWKVGK